MQQSNSLGQNRRKGEERVSNKQILNESLI